MTGVLPAKVVPVAQIVWSEPALATVGVAVNVITTSSVEATQGAFAIVQRNVYVLPGVPVNTEVGLLAVVTDPPVPVMIVQVPVPTVGVLPANTAVFPQTVWSGPAFATVGAAVNVMTTSSVEGAHGAFETVQRNV